MGYFHPLLVHLPIGFLLLAILMDLLAYRSAFVQYRAAVPSTLFLGFVAALLSCGTGYLLANSGDYEPTSLQTHQQAGWIVAGASGVLWLLSGVFFRKQSQAGSRWMSALLLALGGVIAYTGHQGGSLTHGSDYLSWRAANESEKPVRKIALVDSTALELPKVNPDLPLEVDVKAVEQLRKLGFNVRYMLKRPVMLDITLPAQTGKSTAELMPALQAVAQSIVWLNLSDNGFSEKDLTWLKACQNLEKLKLSKNPVGNGIVEILAGLKHLEALNLNETEVSAAGVKQLENGGVDRIYAWQAK
jgi:uncharacterized membrane protein